MANYLAFRRVLERDGYKRFTYVCGSEIVLIEDVVDRIKRAVDPHDLDYVSVTAGETSDKEIWAHLNQYPIDSECIKLVVVREADRIQSWEPFIGWMLSRTMPKVVGLFVSRDEEWPTDRLPEVRDRLLRSGLYVRCSPLNEENAVAYLQLLGSITPVMARHLLK